MKKLLTLLASSALTGTSASAAVSCNLDYLKEDEEDENTIENPGETPDPETNPGETPDPETNPGETPDPETNPGENTKPPVTGGTDEDGNEIVEDLDESKDKEAYLSETNLTIDRSTEKKKVEVKFQNQKLLEVLSIIDVTTTNDAFLAEISKDGKSIEITANSFSGGGGYYDVKLSDNKTILRGKVQVKASTPPTEKVEYKSESISLVLSKEDIKTVGEINGTLTEKQVSVLLNFFNTGWKEYTTGSFAPGENAENGGGWIQHPVFIDTYWLTYNGMEFEEAFSAENLTKLMNNAQTSKAISFEMKSKYDEVVFPKNADGENKVIFSIAVGVSEQLSLAMKKYVAFDYVIEGNGLEEVKDNLINTLKIDDRNDLINQIDWKSAMIKEDEKKLTLSAVIDSEDFTGTADVNCK